MIEAVPASWFSWDYDLFEESRPLTRIDVSWIREAGSFRLDGDEYLISRAAGWGHFVLSRNHVEICRADKRMTRAYDIEMGSDAMALQAIPFRRTYVLNGCRHGGGEIRPAGIFSRRAHARLPEELPRSVQVFFVWLVIILWRRAARSS